MRQGCRLRTQSRLSHADSINASRQQSGLRDWLQNPSTIDGHGPAATSHLPFVEMRGRRSQQITVVVSGQAGCAVHSGPQSSWLAPSRPKRIAPSREHSAGTYGAPALPAHVRQVQPGVRRDVEQVFIVRRFGLNLPVRRHRGNSVLRQRFSQIPVVPGSPRRK